MSVDLQKLSDLLSELKAYDAKLIAVSKTKPTSLIKEVLAEGYNVFGENRAQEMQSKYDELKESYEIEWHMIGHLQRNKIKYVSSFVHLIHSIDSLKLLKAVDAEGKKQNRQIPCLLQMHIASESSKYGFTKEELEESLKNTGPNSFENIEFCGVMGMATLTDNNKLIEQEFSGLKSTFNELKAHYFSESEKFNEISMGMSGDYKIALECGSTMVRIGSAIFGHRD